MNKVCKEANSRSFPNLGSVGMLVPSEVVLYETYLTIADVEQVTGLKNIRQIPFHRTDFSAATSTLFPKMAVRS